MCVSRSERCTRAWFAIEKYYIRSDFVREKWFWPFHVVYDYHVERTKLWADFVCVHFILHERQWNFVWLICAQPIADGCRWRLSLSHQVRQYLTIGKCTPLWSSGLCLTNKTQPQFSSICGRRSNDTRQIRPIFSEFLIKKPSAIFFSFYILFILTIKMKW